jgi:hypothetical protein
MKTTKRKKYKQHLSRIDKEIWEKIKSDPELYARHIMYCGVYQHHKKQLYYDSRFKREEPSVINKMVNGHDRTVLFQNKTN